MIEARVGFDNIDRGGSAQWCTFYIEDDFKNFLDYDGETYYKNRLAPVKYTNTVQNMREKFISNFNNINSIDELINNTYGLLYVYDYEDGFTWW